MKIGLAKDNIEYTHIVKLGDRRKDKISPIYKRMIILRSFSSLAAAPLVWWS
jgi:hypothetical protein